MNVGKMRHRITFQKQSDDKDSLGGYEDEWTDVVTTWAQITPVSGKDCFTQNLLPVPPGDYTTDEDQIWEAAFPHYFRSELGGA